MRISLVVAVDENGVIGVNGHLPWSLPDDLRHFRDLTSGHPVIMGRKTYDALPPNRRPLPDRTNIVITRQMGYAAPGATVTGSLEEALGAAEKTGAGEAFVIGGGEIYRLALPIAQRVHLTRVRTAVPAGDASFPALDGEAWEETARTEHPADARHPFAFTFLTLDRRAAP